MTLAWDRALIELIGALDSFIAIDVELGLEFLRQGRITQDEFARGMEAIMVMQELAFMLEQWANDGQ